MAHRGSSSEGLAHCRPPGRQRLVELKARVAANSLEATLASTVITHKERPARATARPTGRTAIVLLHSRAGDEHEVLPLLDDLDPEGRHLGLFPLGPLESVSEGRHWYVIERAASPEPTTFLPTLEALSAWLDDTLAEHGIDPCRIVLGGFSQGAAMAYALGLAAGRPSPAGILAFSGYLARVEGFDLDLEGRARLPVSIAHGSLDPNVSVDFGREARGRLETAGLAVATTRIRSGTRLHRAASPRRGPCSPRRSPNGP